MLPAHQKIDGVLIAHIRYVDGEFVAYVGKIVNIAAVVGYKRIR